MNKNSSDMKEQQIRKEIMKVYDQEASVDEVVERLLQNKTKDDNKKFTKDDMKDAFIYGRESEFFHQKGEKTIFTPYISFEEWFDKNYNKK